MAYSSQVLSDFEAFLVSNVCASSTAASEAINNWKRTDAESEKLLASVGSAIASTRTGALDAEIAQRWTEFEESIRARTSLMTPREVVRTFGLLEQMYSISDTSDRRSRVRRLRVAPDRPKPDLRTKEQIERDRARELMIWQQQSQGQDPWIQHNMATSRVPPPRPMLAKGRVVDLKANLLERGIDVCTERPLELEAADVEEAIELACLLSHTRDCDLFRGQTGDFHPMPSVLRKGLRSEERDRLDRFKTWAEAHDTLREFCFDRRIDAIAQHYRVPTVLLDFTYNPRIAGFFATDTFEASGARPACIFCLNSAMLDGLQYSASSWMRHYELVPQVIRVEGFGFHRMEAQEGCFVYVPHEIWGSFQMDIIRFPRNGRMETPLREDIYPAERTVIESIVEEYVASEERTQKG